LLEVPEKKTEKVWNSVKWGIRGGGTKRSAEENSVSLLLLFCVSGVFQFPSFLFLHFAMYQRPTIVVHHTATVRHGKEIR